jgi:hypothetical protein
MLAVFAALHAALWAGGSEKKFYADDPLWQEPRPLPVEAARSRKLSDYYDFLQNTIWKTGELQSRAGRPIPAQGVNTLGEVPDSAWYTNRHYRRPMSLEELVRGAGDQRPPAQDAPWKIVAAKNEGVTPGFTIVDARGRRYVVKFDPQSNPEMASAADVISSKFFHALGYHVPENHIVRFERRQLAIGDRTMVTGRDGKKRPMTSADLDEILAKVPRRADGSYRAMASLYLEGKPLGPFRYHGARSDDPNDTVPHEHRRELRGLRVFAAWLNHDDSRAINTLDMLVRENGVSFIRHYLIDFGSTLGSASTGANSPRSGNAHLFNWRSAAAQMLSLGLYIPRWERARYPDLPAVGRFESAVFDPEKWVPEYPNPAFENMNPDDAFWAARQVMAFSDEQIRAIVAAGQYSDPAAGEWVVRTLIARRDKIGKAFYNRVLPLDRFAVRDGRLEFEDLSVGLDLPRQQYRVRWSSFENESGKQEPLPGETTFRVPWADGAATQYLLAEISSDRSPLAMRVYIRNRAGRSEVVGIERCWDNGRVA